jgi:cytochrome c-type biogenesis protein CcmH/NrfG
MSDDTQSGDVPQPGRQRRWSRRIALAPLWVASVLVLLLAIVSVGAYLMAREPDVVERVLPPPPAPELPAEAARRAEALRALNSGLADQVEVLRQQLEQPPQCPPGTEIDGTGGIRKSSMQGGGRYWG